MERKRRRRRRRRAKQRRRRRERTRGLSASRFSLFSSLLLQRFVNWRFKSSWQRSSQPSTSRVACDWIFFSFFAGLDWEPLQPHPRLLSLSLTLSDSLHHPLRPNRQAPGWSTIAHLPTRSSGSQGTFHPALYTLLQWCKASRLVSRPSGRRCYDADLLSTMWKTGIPPPRPTSQRR